MKASAARSLPCSHFHSRRHLAVRFYLRNCNAMCSTCNLRHNSDPTAYLNFMTERYGPGVVAELEELKASTNKITDEELRQTLERLRAMR
jgi:hypothetical protein